ncbi:hypothetical protein LCGC14_2812570, partial [marine sediment metagenome]
MVILRVFIALLLISCTAYAQPRGGSPSQKYEEKDGSPSIRSRTVILPPDTISQDTGVSDRIELLLVGTESADSTYLRLDLTNDPLTGVELDAGSANYKTTGTGRFDGGLTDDNENVIVNLVFPGLIRASGNLTLDIEQSQLRADDGIDVILNFDTPGLADFQDSIITTTGTGTFGELALGNNEYLYFDTAKNTSLRFSSNHYGILMSGGVGEATDYFCGISGLGFYANTDADGGGTWEPYILIGNPHEPNVIGDRGLVTIRSVTDGIPGERYLLIDCTDGIM